MGQESSMEQVNNNNNDDSSEYDPSISFFMENIFFVSVTLQWL